MFKYTRGMALVALIIFGAVLSPQDSDAKLRGKHDGFLCADCHVSADGYAGSLFDQTPSCLNSGAACHDNTGVVEIDLAEADASRLYSYTTTVGSPMGTSHAWGVPYLEPGAGASTPRTIRQDNYIRGVLACSSCHYPHYTPFGSLTTEPLLKLDNTSDALCLDCHRSWNVTSVSTAPPAGKQMSHPVGVTLNPVLEGYTAPLNPQGFAGSELKLVGESSDKVSCSTCHGVHFADSDPNTDATMTGLSPVPLGQGVLLRRYNDSQLCMDCHTYQQHGPALPTTKWQNCRVCHSPHNVGSNLKLIRFDNISTPFGNKTAIFDNGSTNLAFTASGKGICEVCHDIVATWGFTNWSTKHKPLFELDGDPVYISRGPEIECLDCHQHELGDGTNVGSFSAGGEAACNTSCHGYPPILNTQDVDGYALGYAGVNEANSPHAKHADNYPFTSGNCKACHYDDSGSRAFHKDGNYNDVVFGLYSWGSGVWGNYSSAASKYSCDTVYCHSNGAPLDVGIAVPNNNNIAWDDPQTPLGCGGCHDANPATNMHQSHTAGNYNLDCINCHATAVSDNTTIASTSVHVNKAKDVVFGGLTTGGSYSSPQCTDSYCHGNFPNGASADPFWNLSSSGACGTCHNVGASHTAVAHDRHITDDTGKYNFDCYYCHDEQMDIGANSTLASDAGHVDGTKSISFVNDLSRTNGAGVFRDADGMCSKLYCHSAGTDTNSTYFFVNESTIWTGVTTCKSCHGDSALGGWTSAMPNYTNGQDNKENSHNAHVRNNGYDCKTCHVEIVGADNKSIIDTAKHVDGAFDVFFTSIYAGATYDTGSQVCSSVSCHGNNDVKWGDSVSCADCHLTAAGADVDQNSVFGNNTAAQIAMSQWTSTGHGRDSGSTYFSGASGAGKGCLEGGSGAGCHDASVSHNDTGNPFRLYSSPTDTNILCKVCHAGSAADYHASATTEDRFTFDIKCLDCHDAHGDDNIFMMHSTIYEPLSGNGYAISNNKGVAYSGLSSLDLDFKDNAGAGDYGTATATDGLSKVCNVCHSQTYDQTTPNPAIERYQRNMNGVTVEQHFTTTKCTACHQHKNGFEGESCEACHGMPPTSTLNLISTIDNYQSGSDTAGAHAAHTAKYDTGTNCDLCHDDGMNSSGNPFNDLIDMDFSSTLGSYTTGTYDGQGAVDGGTYSYTGKGEGTANDNYVCNDVKCHGTEIVGDMAGSNTVPAWNAPGTGACGTCHDHTGALAQAGLSHEAHAETNSIGCLYCHKPDTDTTHVDSNIDFTDATSKAATNVCLTCHVDVTGAKAEWTAGTDQICEDCHVTTDPDTDDFTFTGFTSGSMTQARVNFAKWTTTGHGRTTAYPVSSNQGAELGCEDCHDSAKNHQTGASYFRLKVTDDDPDTLCLDCHGSGTQIDAQGLRTAAPVLSLVTSYQNHTKANLDAAGYSTGTWNFIPKCIDCHDPHGDGNIFMMHSKVADQGSDAVGVPANFPNNSTVNFTAIDGADSYDDGDGVANLCVVCHDNTTHDGSTDTHSTYGSTDCRACHDHKLGFTPAGECDDCHNAALDVDDFSFGNNTTAQVDFTAWTTTGHGRNTPFPSGNLAASLECLDCHDDTVDHDIGTNPFRLYSSDPDQLCDICHGPAGTASKKGIFNHSSSTTAAAVTGGGRYKFKIKCIDCHDPHGDDNAFMMHSTVAQPNGQANWETSNKYGVPNAGVTWENIDFPDGSSASQSSTSGATAPVKVCNVCHSRTVDWDGPDPDDETRYQRSGSTEAHYVGQDCTGSCHQHKKAFEGEACNVCHGMPPISLGTLIGGGENPSGSIIFGAHSTHVVRFNNSCQECHKGGMQDTSDFASKKINLDFSGGFGSYTTGQYYGQSAVNSTNEYPYAGAGYGGEGSAGDYRCENVRCHGSVITGDMIGTDSTPDWDEPLTGACGECHAVTGGAQPGSSHETHVDTNSIGCKYCHEQDTDPTHVDSNIDFNDATTSKAATDVCLNCHVDVTSAKADWGPPGVAQTCTECHVTTAADTDHFTFGFFTSVGMTQARINDTDWTTIGHGRTSAYPSGNQGAELGCDNCHDSGKSHQTGASYFRLKATDDPDTLCLDCHGSGGQINTLGLRAAATVLSNVTGYQGHTYSNISAGGYDNMTTWHFQPKCIDCHDPHGDGNIFMIHSKVADEGSSVVAPLGVPANFPNNSTVNFTAVFGADSYDNGTAQALCVVCHDRTANNGDHTVAGYGDKRGQDCRGCHDHKTGFTPKGCDGCHGTPPGVDDKYGPDLSSSTYDWDDTTGGSHVKHNDLGETCDECHTSFPGGDAQHQKNKANASLVTMDGNYSFGILSGYMTDGTEDDTCSDVTCHGGRAYERMWKAPTDCDDCHGERAFNGLNNISTGSHYKHTKNGVGYYNYECTECHIDNLDNYTTHYDSFVDMTGIITYQVRGTGFEPFTSGNEYSTCSVTYCHGETLPSKGLSQTPTWGGGGLGCENCHYSTGAPASMGGSHPKHVASGAGQYSYDCFNCHVETTTDNSTINNYTAHVNANMNVDFDSLRNNNNGGSFNGTTDKQCLNTYCHSFGTITGVGPFQMGNYTADWDSPRGCDYCHGDSALGGWTSAMPNYDDEAPKNNSHRTHVTTKSYECKDCHIVTTTDNTTINDVTVHVNSTYDVDIEATYDTDADPSNNYAGVICSDVTCHGAEMGAGATGSDPTPEWGDSATGQCGTCHLNTDITQGGHWEHIDPAGYNRACDVCHTASTDPDHVDTSVDFLGSVDLATAATTVCGTVLCHDADGTEARFDWYSSAANRTRTCVDCHDGRANVGSMPERHPIHADTYSFTCVKCHVATISDDTTILSKTIHVNGTDDVDFDSVAPDNSGGGYNAGRVCDNTYCHTNGTDISAPYAATALANYTADWDDSAVGCDYCHGDSALGGWTSAMPNYPNLSPKANSHQAHVNGGYDCNVCHDPVVGADNASIEAGGIAEHVDGDYDVDVSAYGGTYTFATKICSSVSCHGPDVVWGDPNVTCFTCHGAAETLDYKPIATAGAANPVVYAEYTTTGHGRSVGNYTLSGTAGAGYSIAANGCDNCHDSGVGHLTKDPLNPYRIKGSFEDDLNGLCMDTAACHQGYKNHDETDTASGRTWPMTTKCVDCHDPHGDSNEYMIRSAINAPEDNTGGGSDAYGTPLDQTVVAINFQSRAGWDNADSYASSSGAELCEACHSKNIPSPVLKFNQENDDNADTHTTNFDCKLCHQHAEGFAGGGDCDACHGYPPIYGDAASYKDAPVSEGKGLHESHFTHLTSVLGLTVDVTDSTYGSGGNHALLCGVCHTNEPLNHKDGGRLINFGDGDPTYSFDGTAPFYNGTTFVSYTGLGGAYPKTCSNVSCHFQESAGWQDPDLPKFP